MVEIELIDYNNIVALVNNFGVKVAADQYGLKPEEIFSKFDLYDRLGVSWEAHREATLLDIIHLGYNEAAGRQGLTPQGLLYEYNSPWMDLAILLGLSNGSTKDFPWNELADKIGLENYDGILAIDKQRRYGERQKEKAEQ